MTTWMRHPRAACAVAPLLVAAALLLAACGGAEFRGTIRDKAIPAPDFTLTDAHGRPFRLGEQRGNVVLLYFGYTQCPDVCPTTLAEWKKVAAGLGDQVGRVRFVFVTVDPERDTPERLGVYMAAFNPDFIGLTGSLEELKAVYDAYGVVAEKDTSSGSAAGYLISHTASVFVIDPAGRWRMRFTYGTPAEDILHDLRLLLE